MTREVAHQLSFEKALYSIRNNFPPGKLPPVEQYTDVYYNMSQGEIREVAGIAMRTSTMSQNRCLLLMAAMAWRQ